MRFRRSKLHMILAASALAIAGVLSTSSAMAFNSTSYAMRCDGCSTPQIILNLTTGYSQQDSVYVFSMPGGSLRLFQRHGKAGGGFTFQEATVTDAADVAYFQLVREWYAGNGSSLTYVDSVALNLVKTAGLHAPVTSMVWGGAGRSRLAPP
jgi:hypothetical protein